MTNRQRRIWFSGRRNGLSLIKVVAGVVIAGTLLVAVINASSMHSRQLRQIESKQAAIDAIDRFLVRWSFSKFSQGKASVAANEASVALV